MAFFDEAHKQLIAKIETIWTSLQDLATLATQYGINENLCYVTSNAGANLSTLGRKTQNNDSS